MSGKDPIHLEDRTQTGARLFSPTAGRNKAPIADAMTAYLPDGARVLEIASGSGEHGAHICTLRPDIIWQASDPDADSRASQNDWAKDCGGRMLKSLAIDTSQAGWADNLGEYDVIYCANMIHIAPWEAATGLAAGAGKLLKSGATFILYGPFKEGKDTAESNLGFDVSLKSRNPSWGVRNLDDVKHIFSHAGFTHEARIVMPKENRMLIFTKTQ
ncbi:class I SAM-dependent methyltransferase [Hellea sp.]|nr:class I SAM-dependent methyltransferase [Hellea sp.]